MGVILGAPYASGILATGASSEARYGYAPVEESVLNRVKAIEKVCSEHKIPLKAAALQFPAWASLGGFRHSGCHAS